MLTVEPERRFPPWHSPAQIARQDRFAQAQHFGYFALFHVARIGVDELAQVPEFRPLRHVKNLPEPLACVNRKVGHP